MGKTSDLNRGAVGVHGEGGLVIAGDQIYFWQGKKSSGWDGCPHLRLCCFYWEGVELGGILFWLVMPSIEVAWYFGCQINQVAPSLCSYHHRHHHRHLLLSGSAMVGPHLLHHTRNWTNKEVQKKWHALQSLCILPESRMSLWCVVR